MLLSTQHLCSQTRHLDTARKYIGVVERTGNNDGLWIETWQRFVGIPKGSPYCAAFVSWVLHQARAVYPCFKSATATKFITNQSIKAEDVYEGRATIDSSYLAIWRNGNTWKGHIAFVYLWKKKTGRTIEANTSPGVRGSQRNGNGVWDRVRAIEPWKYFRITHFTPIRYRDEWETTRNIIRSYL